MMAKKQEVKKQGGKKGMHAGHAYDPNCKCGMCGRITKSRNGKQMERELIISEYLKSNPPGQTIETNKPYPVAIEAPLTEENVIAFLIEDSKRSERIVEAVVKSFPDIEDLTVQKIVKEKKQEIINEYLSGLPKDEFMMKLSDKNVSAIRNKIENLKNAFELITSHQFISDVTNHALSLYLKTI